MTIKSILKHIAEFIGVKGFISSVHGRYLLKKQSDQFNKGNKELLIKVDELLTSKGLEYWLNYGTLLGAFRDHDFIKHDYDLDIGMWWKDQEGVKELFLKNGFKLINEFHFGEEWNNPDRTEFRFEYAGALIDVDFYTIDDNGMAFTFNPLLMKGVDYSKAGVKLPVQVEKISNPISGLSHIEFIGHSFLVPSNTEEYIEYNYGKNWRTPLSVSDGYDYHEAASNIVLTEFKGYMMKS